MDYLDPQKEMRHHLTLMIGYGLIAIAIAAAAYLLINRAIGYDLKNGQVVLNGELLLASQPHPASVYLNGQLNSAKTNSRLFLPGGLYDIRLERPGYRSWQQTISVPGGGIRHVDYPFLIPKTLKSTPLARYAGSPAFISQSLDRRWLVVEQPGSLNDFWLYDLKNPTKQPTSVSLPSDLLTSTSTGSSSLQEVSWASDNRHLLLQHLYDNKSEYILLDRSDPELSLNLNRTLKVSPAKLTFNNQKYDQYYLYMADQSLQTASLKSAVITPVLSGVLAYKTYGSHTVLYVTKTDAPTGKVLVKLQDGDRTYALHSLPESNSYLVDLTTYSDTLYVAAGAASENKLYIYKDPIGQLNNQPTQAVVPIQVLHVTSPTYLSFSNTAQFVMLEGGSDFGVYDIENQQGYNYMIKAPLDAPQTHVSWMDGNRFAYSSAGHVEMVDYDNGNAQALQATTASYLPAFAPDYKYVYTIVPSQTTAGEIDLMQASLLTPADQ